MIKMIIQYSYEILWLELLYSIPIKYYELNDYKVFL